MVKRFFDRHSETDILDAIRWAESETSGEIRVHVRRFCRGDAMAEARKIFRKLRLDRTKLRNGVLFYIALSSRRFAVLGDEGIHAKVGESFWNETRDRMAGHFSKGEIKEGIVAGVMDAGEKLKQYFPAEKENKNELPDALSRD